MIIKNNRLIMDVNTVLNKFTINLNTIVIVGNIFVVYLYLTEFLYVYDDLGLKICE